MTTAESKSFFCKAAVLLDLENLGGCLDKTDQKIRTQKVKQGDVKKRRRRYSKAS